MLTLLTMLITKITISISSIIQLSLAIEIVRMKAKILIHQGSLAIQEGLDITIITIPTLKVITIHKTTNIRVSRLSNILVEAIILTTIYSEDREIVSRMIAKAIFNIILALILMGIIVHTVIVRFIAEDLLTSLDLIEMFLDPLLRNKILLKVRFHYIYLFRRCI